MTFILGQVAVKTNVLSQTIDDRPTIEVSNAFWAERDEAIASGGASASVEEMFRVLAEEVCDGAVAARNNVRLATAAREVADSTGRTMIPLAGDMRIRAEGETNHKRGLELADIDICATRKIARLPTRRPRGLPVILAISLAHMSSSMADK